MDLEDVLIKGREKEFIFALMFKTIHIGGEKNTNTFFLLRFLVYSLYFNFFYVTQDNADRLYQYIKKFNYQNSFVN